MDLPDDLNLDEDGKDEEGGEGDGMFSIQASPLIEDILPFKTLGLVIFCKEVSYVHQGCIKNPVKQLH